LTQNGPVVAFDFDGTLTVRDTFLAFLRWRAGLFGSCLGAVRLLPAVAAYVISRDRERLKERAIGVFLRGARVTQVEEEARVFAAERAASLIRPDALRTWRRHRADGATMAIVTASPEVIIAPFARGLGADRLLGTRLAADLEGRLTGRLEGRNCRGPEKVRRLKEAFGDSLALSAAYGDTDGDKEMLEAADEGFMRFFVEAPLPARSGG